MSASFSISIEPDYDLIRIDIIGFFSGDDVTRFTHELGFFMGRLRCRPNAHITLCNVSGMKIQSQEMVAAFSKVVGDPVFRSRKLAFVTGSTLARMQTRRLTDRDGVAYFTEAADARAWLLA